MITDVLRRKRSATLVPILFAAFIVFLGDAQACPLCFSGMVITPGQKLDSADQAVLAIPSNEADQFRIVAVVKGDVDSDEVIREPGASAGVVGPLTSPGRPLPSPSALAATSGKPLLLVRNGLSEQWTSLGPIDVAYAGWLRQVAATHRGNEPRPVRTWPRTTFTWSYLSDAEWRERLALVAPHLESGEPLAAEIAYGELARAPYGAMRILKPQLDAQTIAAWIDDPGLASRRPAYTLLLGIAGGPDYAADLEHRIDATLKARDATNLAALLAADLELRGTDRVAWIETTFFADRQSTLQEIDAALLALSVHGGADGVVPRQRVIEAYRFFIEERKPMAGFVAQELADWEAWDATADYVEIIKSNTVKDPAGQFAIVNFLEKSPEAIAKTALESLNVRAN